MVECMYVMVTLRRLILELMKCMGMVGMVEWYGGV